MAARRKLLARDGVGFYDGLLDLGRQLTTLLILLCLFKTALKYFLELRQCAEPTMGP